MAGGYFKNKLQLFDVSTFVLFEKGPFSRLFKEVDPKYVSTLCQVFNFEKAEEKISKIDHFFQVNNSMLQIFIHCINKVKVAQ